MDSAEIIQQCGRSISVSRIKELLAVSATQRRYGILQHILNFI